MSVTFTKLFSSITESTVWCESAPTRLCWITMLAMADSKGRVWASIPGLANRARIPVDDTRVAIHIFLSPDPDSRTPANEGRRIEVIDGGWRLLNHEKYRAIRDEESAKESKRKYINARRAQEKVDNLNLHVENVERSIDNAEAYTEADTDKTNTKSKAMRATRLPTDWEMPADFGNWALQEKQHWTNDDVLKVAANFKDFWNAKPGQAGTKLNWLATWRIWVRNTK